MLIIKEYIPVYFLFCMPGLCIDIITYFISGKRYNLGIHRIGSILSALIYFYFFLSSLLPYGSKWAEHWGKEITLKFVIWGLIVVGFPILSIFLVRLIEKKNANEILKK